METSDAPCLVDHQCCEQCSGSMPEMEFASSQAGMGESVWATQALSESKMGQVSGGGRSGAEVRRKFGARCKKETIAAVRATGRIVTGSLIPNPPKRIEIWH